MRRRMLAPALLAAGLALTACGGDDETTVSADVPPPGRYVGETSQGLPISFLVAGGSVHDVSFGWRARCEDGQVHANTIALPGAAIDAGAFLTAGPLETGGVAEVEGDFDDASASGELSRAKGSAFGTDCLATGIEWSADLVEAPSGDVT